MSGLEIALAIGLGISVAVILVMAWSVRNLILSFQAFHRGLVMVLVGLDDDDESKFIITLKEAIQTGLAMGPMSERIENSAMNRYYELCLDVARIRANLTVSRFFK